MKVIKKDGRVQDFNKDKLYTSLYNASVNSEKGELNESDIKIVVEDICKKLKELRSDDGDTSSYEIKGLISGMLMEDGFSEVVKNYLNY